jgi:hypothetical protein
MKYFISRSYIKDFLGEKAGHRHPEQDAFPKTDNQLKQKITIHIKLSYQDASYMRTVCIQSEQAG